MADTWNPLLGSQFPTHNNLNDAVTYGYFTIGDGGSAPADNNFFTKSDLDNGYIIYDPTMPTLLAKNTTDFVEKQDLRSFTSSGNFYYSSYSSGNGYGFGSTGLACSHSGAPHLTVSWYGAFGNGTVLSLACSFNETDYYYCAGFTFQLWWMTAKGGHSGTCTGKYMVVNATGACTGLTSVYINAAITGSTNIIFTAWYNTANTTSANVDANLTINYSYYSSNGGTYTSSTTISNGTHSVTHNTPPADSGNIVGVSITSFSSSSGTQSYIPN